MMDRKVSGMLAFLQKVLAEKNRKGHSKSINIDVCP
jgi:hypothetical protein